MSKKNLRLFFPLLLGLYPALELVSHNINQMVFSAGLRSLALAALFSLLAWVVFSLIFKNEYRAAFLCAWFLFFFFAYGHVYDLLEGWKVFGFVIGRHRYIFPLWLLFFAAGGWLTYLRTRQPVFLARILNWMSLLLLVLPIIHIVSYESFRHRSLSGGSGQVAGSVTAGGLSRSGLPDIYYIILDGYPRQDVLMQYHNVDNSDFIRQLEAAGFYVPDCSQSNYASTELSLESSMNMDYLASLNPEVKSINFVAGINNSKIRQFLQGLGYQTVSFESGVWFTEFHDADHYIDRQQPIMSSFFDFKNPSEFEVLFIRTTVLRLVQESKTAWLNTIFQNPRRNAYERVLFQFDQLGQSASLPSPKFVFIHIIAPHSPPFVFNGAGEFSVSESVDPALAGVIQYVNQRTLEAVRAILANSARQPVILIQGDHGLDTEVRLANFMAYYLPDGGSKSLYPTITPVNSFRLVLDTYFGQSLPLLPDISYYSSYDDPYKFTEELYPCSH
jgi:hypothetical protein